MIEVSLLLKIAKVTLCICVVFYFKHLLKTFENEQKRLSGHLGTECEEAVRTEVQSLKQKRVRNQERSPYPAPISPVPNEVVPVATRRQSLPISSPGAVPSRSIFSSVRDARVAFIGKIVLDVPVGLKGFR
jgi:hypothetical protein